MQKLNDGRVLIAGGKDPLNCTWTAEIYDPATGKWSWIPNMKYARGGYFTMTMMPDGQLLVTGGVASTGYWNSAEIYDPYTNQWKRTGALTIDHVGHTATLLPNGQVLVALGYTDRAELYGPPIPRAKTDFNGDGKSDIVFSNGTDLHYLFTMNGTTVQSGALLPRAAPGWSLVGIGDFDGNGSADLLWQNTANASQYWIYLMSGATKIGGGPLVVAPGYRPTFIADFNGDGKSDILFENGVAGRWIFFMPRVLRHSFSGHSARAGTVVAGAVVRLPGLFRGRRVSQGRPRCAGRLQSHLPFAADRARPTLVGPVAHADQPALRTRGAGSLRTARVGPGAGPRAAGDLLPMSAAIHLAGANLHYAAVAYVERSLKALLASAVRRAPRPAVRDVHDSQPGDRDRNP